MVHTDTLAVIIPARNEARLLPHVLKTLLRSAKPRDIYVVDDGSTDSTAGIAQKYGCHVLRLPVNHGKANALNTGIAHFRLADRYQYIFPLDADTTVTPSFIPEIIRCFREARRKPAAVVGRVTGRTKTWVTTYRIWEYEIGQTIYKSAQSTIGAISVCSGCATVYRAPILKRFPIPTDTMTEDMDLTFWLQRRRAGAIVYCPEARVVTQDPDSLREFIKQCRRWYTGFWQCVAKYDLPWGGRPIDAEVALLATDSLLSSLVTVMFVVLFPFLVRYNPLFLAATFCFDLFLFMLPTVIWTSVKTKAGRMIRMIPLFYILRFTSSIIFLESFIRYATAFDSRVSWNKIRRYDVEQV